MAIGSETLLVTDPSTRRPIRRPPMSVDFTAKSYRIAARGMYASVYEQ